MGAPLQRERTIAGQLEKPKSRASSDGYPFANDDNDAEPEAEYIGSQLKRVFTQNHESWIWNPVIIVLEY